jgi:hypothetical protein
VLAVFRDECLAAGRDAHWKLLFARQIEPVLNASEPPPLAELCEANGISRDDGYNILAAASRRFRTLMRRQIASSLGGEHVADERDVNAEIADLIQALSPPPA